MRVGKFNPQPFSAASNAASVSDAVSVSSEVPVPESSVSESQSSEAALPAVADVPPAVQEGAVRKQRKSNKRKS